jgi:hypothetical protein
VWTNECTYVPKYREKSYTSATSSFTDSPRKDRGLNVGFLGKRPATYWLSHRPGERFHCEISTVSEEELQKVNSDAFRILSRRQNFWICRSTGEMLLDFLKVMNTANLSVASFTDYYPSNHASGHRFWVKQEIVCSVYRYFNTYVGTLMSCNIWALCLLKYADFFLSMEFNLLQKPSVVCNCDIKSFEQLVINISWIPECDRFSVYLQEIFL